MTLIWIIILPILGGLLAWIISNWTKALPRIICALALLLDLVFSISLWHPGAGLRGEWLGEFNVPWIPQFGISIHLAADGLSLLLMLLTSVLGLIALFSSAVPERQGFFLLNLMAVLSGVMGVFTSFDLFLFYFFWELMLVPMYFLIALWGHERRVYAAIKFFIFTQASGLLMLISILALFFVHGASTGEFTFDYFRLLGTGMSGIFSMLLFLGFFIAFAVKLPAFPFHSWLPDAHTEAPTAGSVVLAGLLLKTGGYGLIRFAVPLFPQAALTFAPVGLALGTISILYGAVLSFSQKDLKRLIADTSISHMGFVMLGVFAWNKLALNGAVFQMLCHGVSTGILFVLAGALQDRLGTRDMGRMGGFWADAPLMGAVLLFFGLASLGLPGMGNFIAEFMVLLGAFRAWPVYSIISTAGLVAATIYSLWMVQRVFFGPKPASDMNFKRLPDLGLREAAISGIAILIILFLGLFPNPVFRVSNPALQKVQGPAKTEIGLYKNIPNPSLKRESLNGQ
jgi:NADH-quinone oxidoreductase subunit M